MVRCVVKCCKNTRDSCVPEQISFFQLPENSVMREGWFKKIGEIYLPTNIKNGKFCKSYSIMLKNNNLLHREIILLVRTRNINKSR